MLKGSQLRNSVAGNEIWPKLKAIQAFIVFSVLPARMRKIHSKMKALEWSQHFSHYKSMGILPDVQGQLTPQTLVRSCRILNPSEIW